MASGNSEIMFFLQFDILHFRIKYGVQSMVLKYKSEKEKEILHIFRFQIFVSSIEIIIPWICCVINNPQNVIEVKIATLQIMQSKGLKFL